MMTHTGKIVSHQSASSCLRVCLWQLGLCISQIEVQDTLISVADFEVLINHPSPCFPMRKRFSVQLLYNLDFALELSVDYLLEALAVF